MITITVRIAELQPLGIAIDSIPLPDQPTELERLHYLVMDRCLAIGSQLLVEATGNGYILEDETIDTRVRAAFDAAVQKPPAPPPGRGPMAESGAARSPQPVFPYLFRPLGCTLASKAVEVSRVRPRKLCNHELVHSDRDRELTHCYPRHRGRLA